MPIGQNHAKHLPGAYQGIIGTFALWVGAVLAKHAYAILYGIDIKDVPDDFKDTCSFIFAFIIITSLMRYNNMLHDKIYKDKDTVIAELQNYKLEAERSSSRMALEAAQEKWIEDDNETANKILSMFVQNVSAEMSSIAAAIARFNISKIIESIDADAATYMNRAANMLHVAEGIAPDAAETRLLRLQFDTFNEKMQESLLEIWETRGEVSMTDNPEILKAGGWLVDILSNRGRREEALPIAREVWERRKAVLNPDHIDTLAAGAWVVDILYNVGMKEEAIPIAREIWERRKEVLTPSHPDTIVSAVWLIQILANCGMHDDAEPVAREIWELKEEASPSDESAH